MPLLIRDLRAAGVLSVTGKEAARIIGGVQVPRPEGIMPSHDGHQTKVAKKGRRLNQVVRIWRPDYKQGPANWPEKTDMATRFEHQTEEQREAKKKAAIEKQLRKQRKRRGDLK